MLDPGTELFLRSAAGLVVAAGALAWLWNAGSVRATRLFGPAGGDIRSLAVVTWTCAVVTIAAMLLGAFGVLHPGTWLVLAVAGGLLIRRNGATTWRDRHVPPAASDSWDPGPSWLFCAATAALVLGRLVYGLRNPPADVDSILYHMPMAAHWMATGGLGAAQFEPQLFANFYPGNVEILALGSAWLTGRETLMTAPGVLSLGLLAFAVRGLAIETGAKRALAEVLAIGLACAPGVLKLTAGLRVDNVMAAWFAVALLFVLRARRTRSHGDLEVALCAIGLVGGSKATGPVLASIAFAALVMGPGLRTRLSALASCRFGLAAMVIAGGFWIFRNAVASGNPIYPAAVSFGPWSLPGLAGHDDVLLTSQLAMWRAGLPGHLSVLNLWRYFGPIGLALLPGALASVAILFRPRGPGDRRASIALLGAVVLATMALTIVQPFSGANEPARSGGHLTFSVDNVRCLMPTLVAVVPLAALGLSGLPALPVAAVCGLLAVAALVPRAGHIVPAFMLVVLLGIAWAASLRRLTRSRVWSAALALSACAIVAAAVTAVEPMRERMADVTWDTMIRRFDGVPASVVREVLVESGRRPIAVAGMTSVWPFYGREMKGRPEYVPIGYPLARARELWHFAPDQRASADAGLWMRNLRESGAPFVVLVTGERLRPIEREWCEHDPAHFAPVYVTAQQAVYRVTGM